MLYGLDVSHWNSISMIADVIEKNDMLSFMFIKASEGATWRDPKAEDFVNLARTNGLEVGFYHYCRPDNGNSPREEALNFFNTVHDILAKEWRLTSVALAIDWEGKSLEYPRWLDEFIHELTKLSGVNPILYCSQSQVKRLGEILDTDKVGLWCAQWNERPCEITDYSPWKVCAFHQYTSEPYDKNVFFGCKEQLMKYFAHANEDVPESDCTCTCSYCGGKG